MEVENPQIGCGGAEAVLNIQPNSSIAITYHPLYGPHDDLLLLEVDEKLLPDIIGQKVTIRGHPDEDAVLCTQSKTYSMKFVGTSNSVFLIPPLSQSVPCENSQDNGHKYHEQKVVGSVIKVAPGNMEIVEVAPRLDKLKLLLGENLYGFEGVVEEDLEGMEQDRRLYKWDDLVDKIQASDDELKSGLWALSAVEIDGYWRIVDDKYMDLILTMLFHNTVLNDWSLNALDENEIVHVLDVDGFPGKLVRHCLRVYGNKVNESDDCNSTWRLNERRVCLHFAKQILREGKRKMEAFMQEWQRRIPEGMQATVDMLEGEVLTETIGVETWVRAFSSSSLPSTPAERFSLLFRERPKWDWKDLQPFIRDLKVPGLSSEALLLKYTRRTQALPNSEPVFSAR